MKRSWKYLRAVTIAGSLLAIPAVATASVDNPAITVQKKKRSITEEQKEDLQFMFQEEKLARDVSTWHWERCGTIGPFSRSRTPNRSI